MAPPESLWFCVRRDGIADEALRTVAKSSSAASQFFTPDGDGTLLDHAMVLSGSSMRTATSTIMIRCQ
jgi:hypothetical protein